MPSPFPGMDPYLERPEVWHDFHERFIPYAAEMLGQQVRPKYVVKLDEHVYIHELPADERRLIGKPDVAILRKTVRGTEQHSPTALLAPAYAIFPLAIDEERLGYVEIVDRVRNQVVTVIELLSPSNKDSDRQSYLAKRRQYLQSGVRLVEIDLLRGGTRLPLDDAPACDYYAMVAQPVEMPRVGFWSINLRDSLPVIPIPLRDGDPNACLDLQKLVSRVYDAAGYEDYIYENNPQPPLCGEDAAWAAALVTKS